MSVARLGLVPCALFALVACSDDLGSYDGSPRYTIEVQPLPLPPYGTSDHDFTFALRTLDAQGRQVSDTGLNAAGGFGIEDAITYITECASGPSQLEVSLAHFAGDVVQPVGPLAVDFTCVGDADVWLDYEVALAVVDETDHGQTITFGDVTCETSELCGRDGTSATVRCQRSANDGSQTRLGVAGSRVVCGGLEAPIAAVGASDAFGSTFVGETESDGASARWTVRAPTTSPVGCWLEASLVAAPELQGGALEPCRAWPELRLALPLGARTCDGPAVSVGYVEGSDFQADTVIDARGAHAPIGRAPAARCGVAPTSDPTSSESGVGFVDVALELVWPTSGR